MTKSILTNERCKLIYTIDIIPQTKPRLTRQDRWLNPPRTCVKKYYDYCEELRSKFDVNLLPNNIGLIFYLPMPKSWSNKKKEELNLTKCLQSPDFDNLAKAFFDALFSKHNLQSIYDPNIPKNDSHIWDVRVIKVWAEDGKIQVYKLEEMFKKHFF